MLKERDSTWVCNAVITACLVFPTIGLAQSGTTEQGENELILEEVIVTATRRAVALQDVPQSITALTSQALDNMGAVNLEDYALSVPGL
ncbi:MAG: TonB-dependent receptor, partial [Deltaproteobacteria bacterium]|nr:TonB-dependent receptor [Deltaproteobacteria bacterium]